MTANARVMGVNAGRIDRWVSAGVRDCYLAKWVGGAHSLSGYAADWTMHNQLIINWIAELIIQWPVKLSRPV
jgi:hypothetical protein